MLISHSRSCLSTQRLVTFGRNVWVSWAATEPAAALSLLNCVFKLNPMRQFGKCVSFFVATCLVHNNVGHWERYIQQWKKKKGFTFETFGFFFLSPEAKMWLTPYHCGYQNNNEPSLKRTMYRVIPDWDDHIKPQTTHCGTEVHHWLQKLLQIPSVKWEHLG